VDFVGIERNTKLVLAHELGNRTIKSATRFIQNIARATDPAQKFQLTTDGLMAYNIAVGNVLGHQGERVDYAQLVKIYTQEVPEEVRRYSPRAWLKPFPQRSTVTQTRKKSSHPTLRDRTSR
jgi:hypothetical protein